MVLNNRKSGVLKIIKVFLMNLKNILLFPDFNTLSATSYLGKKCEPMKSQQLSTFEVRDAPGHRSGFHRVGGLSQ